MGCFVKREGERDALEGCLAELEAGARLGVAGNFAQDCADLVLDLDNVAFLLVFIDGGAEHEAWGRE